MPIELNPLWGFIQIKNDLEWQLIRDKHNMNNFKRIKPGDWVYIKACYGDNFWGSGVYKYHTEDEDNYVLATAFLGCTPTLYSKYKYSIKRVPIHITNALGLV